MKKYLFLLALCFFFAGCTKMLSPSVAYSKIVENANKGNWEYVYDNIDRYSQGVVNTSLKIMSEMVSSFKGEKGKEKQYASGKERFIAMCKTQEMLADNFKKDKPQIIKIDIRGQKAYLTIKEKDKEQDTVVMYFEDNRWKMHIEE